MKLSLQKPRNKSGVMDDISKFCNVMIQLQTNAQKPEFPLLYYNKVLNHVYFRSSWDTDALKSVQFACRCPIQNLHADIDSTEVLILNSF